MLLSLRWQEHKSLECRSNQKKIAETFRDEGLGGLALENA
jgi:hypothetical protein